MPLSGNLWETTTRLRATKTESALCGALFLCWGGSLFSPSPVKNYLPCLNIKGHWDRGVGTACGHGWQGGVAGRCPRNLSLGRRMMMILIITPLQVYNSLRRRRLGADNYIGRAVLRNAPRVSSARELRALLYYSSTGYAGYIVGVFGG